MARPLIEPTGEQILFALQAYELALDGEELNLQARYAAMKEALRVAVAKGLGDGLPSETV